MNAQIQQLIFMVEALGKTPDFPRKFQCQPSRTSPSGLTLQDVPVMTRDSPSWSLTQTDPALHPYHHHDLPRQKNLHGQTNTKMNMKWKLWNMLQVAMRQLPSSGGHNNESNRG
jgi:hypothetical protein